MLTVSQIPVWRSSIRAALVAWLGTRICLSLMFSFSTNAEIGAAFAITGITVIDPASGRTTADVTLTIRNGIISSAVPGAAAPKGMPAVDGRGKFVIPGLWDMHSHHEATGEALLPLYVAHGVTGTRDMGSELELILRLRKATASATLIGPQIVAAGPILDEAPADWPFRLRVSTAEDARNGVRMLRERGVDFIKVHDRTPRDAYFAIAEEAKRLHLPLAGHVPRGIMFEEAADVGQRSFEHLAGLRIFQQCSGGPDYRADACRPFFAWLARRRIWQTPTLGSWRYLMTIGTPASTLDRAQFTYASRSLKKLWAMNQAVARLTPEDIAGAAAAADAAGRAVADMQKAGVPILAGCDGTVPGFCVHDELELMVRGGLTPLTALQTATSNAAEYLGFSDALGSIEPGKRADFVLLDRNPLEDIRNVRQVWAVVLRGRIFDRRALNEMLVSVQAAVQ
jgi:amidohydrolase family protein